MLIYFIAVLVCLANIANDANAGIFTKHKQSEHDVEFHLYTKKNPLTPYLLERNNERNFEKSPLNPENTTIIYIHGFFGSAHGESAQLIKNDYLSNGEFNVILVDWKKLAEFPNYYEAFKHVPLVGQYTNNLIKWLNDKKAVSIPEIHMIGLSLGAHIASFASDEIFKTTMQKIGRITGLDPAGPGWDKVAVASNGLEKDDANFVDVIHTNTKRYGIRKPLGHADFYVNHGQVQPGCEGNLNTISWKHPSTWTHIAPKIACSHKRALEYFAESISNPFGFPSSKCLEWDPEVKDCTPDPDVFMGFAVSKETKGIFLVETKSEAPYGAVGVPYSKSVIPVRKENADEDIQTDSDPKHSSNKNGTKDPQTTAEIKLIDPSNMANTIYDSNVELKEGGYVYTHPKPLSESEKQHSVSMV